MKLALRKIKLNNLDENLFQCMDNVLPNKPHPAKMERILENSGSGHALFIGDSIDDYFTVVNYNKLKKQGKLQFGLVTDNHKHFPNEAKLLSTKSVNTILEYIIGNQS